MKKNVGKLDKAIRLILVALFAVIAFMYSYWWLIASAILLYTVLTGVCGPYSLLGISTVEKSKKK